MVKTTDLQVIIDHYSESASGQEMLLGKSLSIHASLFSVVLNLYTRDSGMYVFPSTFRSPP